MNKILLVDDDQALLNGLKRHFRKRYTVFTALGGEDALRTLNKEGAIATTVVDMQMPIMNGVELLAEIAKRSPDTTRLMLTGNADQQTAVEAINKGSIFRFFNKPCDPEVLAQGIDAGIRQYELVTAERELLEKTLTGSIKVFVDLLSVTDPEGFARARKIREWAQVLKRHIPMKNTWQLIMAASLFQIGNISMPPELILKQNSKEPLTEAEQKMVMGLPCVASNLIQNIPRLSPVAEIVRYQNKGFNGTGFPEDDVAGTSIPIGGRILKILIDLEKETRGNFPCPKAFEAVTSLAHDYDPELLGIIVKHLPVGDSIEKTEEGEIVEIPVSLLRPGYRLAEDLELKNGRLILGSGTMISVILLQRMKNFEKLYEFKEPIRVIRAVAY